MNHDSGNGRIDPAALGCDSGGPDQPNLSVCGLGRTWKISSDASQMVQRIPKSSCGFLPSS